jgi:ATP-dependent DNA helicase DinG
MMSEQVEMFMDMSDNKNTDTKGGESDSVEIFESHEDRDFDGVEVRWGVEDVFLPGGVLSQHLTGYELRQPQLDLAVAILKGLDKGYHVVAEGSTGVGKSLAYLVPAIKRVLESSGKDARVVIGTSNIALQEQLIKKDLPFLKDILEPGFNFALVKGINNYYCHRAADKMKIEYGQGILPTGANPSDHDISKFYPVFPGKVASICRWAEDSESGDKSELTFEPSQEDWGLVSTTSDECIGSGCSFAEKCFVKRARKALQDTHVIVVNYHLLFAAIAVRKTTGKDIILPPFKYLVCDEAHRIPGIARGFFGWNISEVRVNRAIVQFNKRLREASRKGALLPDEVSRGERWSEETSSRMEGFWKKVNERYGPTRGALRLRQQGGISAVSSAENLLEMSEMMSSAAKGLGKEAGAEALKLSQSLRSIGEALEDVSTFSDPNGVYFIEKFGKYNKVRVCKRLMDVSDLLWQDMICHTTSTIATSATMAIEGNCEYVKGEMGMKESLDIVVSSPFDYKTQALMILSANAPDPTQKESYPDKVARIVEVVIQHARGRTLCLFTSYRVLKYVAAHLAATTSCSYPILVQGDAPRMQLIDKFKTVEDSVLLGTESFWTGVDVPGPSLSCLLIDKIPFSTPGDPVLDALQEAAGGFHKSFWKISVPRAVLQLRQGVGRLIRSRSDKGVLVILDNRLVTKGYGSVFIDSLPPMRRGSGIRNGEITKWLES